MSRIGYVEALGPIVGDSELKAWDGGRLEKGGLCCRIVEM